MEGDTRRLLFDPAGGFGTCLTGGGDEPLSQLRLFGSQTLTEPDIELAPVTADKTDVLADAGDLPEVGQAAPGDERGVGVVGIGDGSQRRDRFVIGHRIVGVVDQSRQRAIEIGGDQQNGL